MTGIVAFAAYVPRLRLRRRAMAEALSWAAPERVASARGQRAMCAWDEDPNTMAVAAARPALAMAAGTVPRSLRLASTTLPFADRQNAAIVAAALALPPDLATTDVTSSQRAGTSALADALRSSEQPSLVIAAERRAPKPGSPQELVAGDGAAAFLVGTGDAVAELLAAHSLTDDFVDHWRTAGAAFDVHWEERWVRDEGVAKIVPRAVAQALAKAGLDGGAVDHFIFAAPSRRWAAEVAQQAGIAAGALCDRLSESCGHSGAAHGLVLLADLLAVAEAGKTVVLASFGQGADVLVLRTTPLLASRQAAAAPVGEGVPHDRYSQFLVLNGLLPFDWGRRAETAVHRAPSVANRHRAETSGFQGGRCRRCGTLQFPRSRICVEPNCRAVDTQEPERLADMNGRVTSHTADWLTHTPQPPLRFVSVLLDGGGKLYSELVDADEAEARPGLPVRMVFRVKWLDEASGNRSYGWKVAPAAPPLSGEG